MEEIKKAIDKLSFQERSELMAMLAPPIYDEWDQQMLADSEAGGKLDRLKESAHEDYQAGKCAEWPPREVLVHPNFWKLYSTLPQNVQLLTDKTYALWLKDFRYPLNRSETASGQSGSALTTAPSDILRQRNVSFGRGSEHTKRYNKLKL